MSEAQKSVWEILIPRKNNGGERFTLAWHHRWDKKVRNVTGGLTIMSPTLKGEWISDTGQVFSESMIPVRICCTYEQINEIMDMTAKHYKQEAVMAYEIAHHVMIRKYG